MSAFGGVLNCDGQPVDPAWLTSLGADLSRRGPDGEAVVEAGELGIVYRSFGVTPEDVAQASLWRSQRAVLAFDGRVDNAADLARSLGVASTASDSAVLFAGLERRGVEFIDAIVGDYALAYWHPETRTLTLARDAAGVRTLYYHHGPRLITFATDLRSLIRATPVDREVDEDYVAGYLGYGVDLDRTIYRHIASVAPAQAVTFDKTGRRATRTTWSLAKDPAPIAYRDDREYEGRFLALFKEGVKARLRTPHPVVSELSGGLDSSSVVCMADRLLRDGEGHAPSFSTISMVSPSAASKDEKFREGVEAQCGRPAYHVKQEATTFVDLPHLSHLHILSSRLVLGSWELAVSGRMRDVGAHTLLTGVGGDEMCYSPHEPSPGLADLLVQGRFSAFHVLASNWSHLLRRPYVSVLRDAIEAAYRCRVSRTPWKQWKPAPWIHPRLRERAIAIREARFRRLRGYRLPRVQMSAFSYEHDLFSISHGDRQEFDARYVTYPFLHRPFVEFMHAVPFEQKLRMAESRSLLRRAMRGVVPETLLTRRGKGQYTTAVIRSFLDGQLDIDHFLVDSMAHARGYVDAAAVRRLVDRARMGQETSLPYTALALETWLRQHASDRPSASVRAVPRAQSLDPART